MAEHIKTKNLPADYTQSYLFMTIISFIAGYVNTYTFVTRGGVFVNNQTGTVSKLGIALYEFTPAGFIALLLPFLVTILGAFVVEHFKRRGEEIGAYRWQQNIVLLECAVFLAVGFLPNTVSAYYINLALTFLMSIQFAAFRTMEGMPLNAMVAVGNLRTTGQMLYVALFMDKSPEYRKKTLRYIIAVGAFIFASFAAAVISGFAGVKSIWFCLPLLTLIYLKHAGVHRARLAEAQAAETEIAAKPQVASETVEDEAPMEEASAEEAPTTNLPEENSEDEAAEDSPTI